MICPYSGGHDKACHALSKLGRSRECNIRKEKANCQKGKKETMCAKFVLIGRMSTCKSPDGSRIDAFLKEDNDSEICAYCGKDHGAPISNNTGERWIFPESCVFAGNTLNVRKLKKIEVSFPLANYPMSCPHCEKSLWRFDMQKHVTKKHPGKECFSEGIISKAEKGLLEKKQPRTPNTLSLKDPEKLNDEGLKLLPLKYFWNATKKKWKKNVFGTFAKRKSATMKKIFGLAWTTLGSS